MNRILAVAISFSTLSFMACHHKDETIKEESKKYIVTTPFVTDTFYNKEYVAQIQSIQNVEIRALAKGYLQKIDIDEGQQVHAGQILFNIMPQEYQAALQKSRAEANTAKLEWLNTKVLEEKNIVSKAELALAKSKYDKELADVAIDELHVSFTNIKAPFDGVTDRIKFKKGSLVDEGTSLTTISNNKEIYAYFNVSEVEYLNYKARSDNDKNKATLLLANNEEHKYNGNIETIEGEFNNETGNIAFRAKFPNPDLLLKHGETGKVKLTIPIHNALIIPQKATYELQDKIYVYVVDKNNIVKARNIIIKQKLPDIYIIESGLEATDTILLEGLQSIKEDDKIKPDFMDSKEVISNLQLIKK